MSALGGKSCPDGPEVRLPLYTRKRTQDGHLAMSVSCHNQTHAPRQLEVLFDHLVGAREQYRRNIKSECLCRLEIENQLEFGRLFDRNITGFHTLENLFQK